MIKKVVLLIIFLSAGVAVFTQEAKTITNRKDPTDKMVLRSNTRDRVIVMRGNMHQRMQLFRRKENIKQNQMQLNRRMMMHRQNRMIQQNRQRDIQRQSIQRQMMQQRRGPRR